MQVRKFDYSDNNGRFSYPALSLKGLLYNPPLKRNPSRTGKECVFFLDTGADELGTLPAEIGQEIGIRQTGTITVTDYQGVRTTGKETYAVALKVKEINFHQIIEVVLTSKDYGILPRKLINQWKLSLNGPKRVFYVTTYY